MLVASFYGVRLYRGFSERGFARLVLALICAVRPHADDRGRAGAMAILRVWHEHRSGFAGFPQRRRRIRARRCNGRSIIGTRSRTGCCRNCARSQPISQTTEMTSVRHDGDGLTLFYLVHLFAEKRDKRAYAPLCERLVRDKDSHAWLGRCASAKPPRRSDKFVRRRPRTDPAPHRRREAMTEFVRASALEALAIWCVSRTPSARRRRGTTCDDLYERPSRAGQAGLWVSTGPTPSRGSDFRNSRRRRASVFEKLDRTTSPTIQDFHAPTGGRAARPSDGLRATTDSGPSSSTIAVRRQLQVGHHRPGHATRRPSRTELFYRDGNLQRTPKRDIGRNDPCPCGSGKKYKKCCLAA